MVTPACTLQPSCSPDQGLRRSLSPVQRGNAEILYPPRIVSPRITASRLAENHYPWRIPTAQAVG